ncbi:hypothetical protein Tco_0972481 [Tanacetum coccineum]
METKDTLSSCSNSEEQQMQQIQDKAKKSCMVSFRQLHSHLKLLSNNDLKGTRAESGFKRAFATLFGQDVETFIGTMFLNVDQLEKQLDKEEFQEIGSMASFKVLETQFQMFIKSRMYMDDEYVVMTRNYFLKYTQLEILEFRDTDPTMKYVKKKASGSIKKSKIQAADQGMMLMLASRNFHLMNKAMTSDHKLFRLGIHDHNIKLSSSLLVPKVVLQLTRQIHLDKKHPVITSVLTNVDGIPVEPTSNKLLVGKHGKSNTSVLEDPSFELETLSRSFFVLHLITGYIKMEMVMPYSKLKSDSLPHAHAQTTKTFY